MENHRAEQLEESHWEETIDFLTRDMPPQEIDIKVLARRYRNYIEELQKNDMEVSAKAVRICSALLNMKAAVVLDYEEEKPEQEDPDPMDFEAEPEDFEQEEQGVDLGEPPELEVPPQPKAKRRMHKGELKDALKDALEVKEKREERQEEREEMDQQFEFEEETIRDRIDSLYSRVQNMIDKSTDGVKFNSLLDERTSEEKIEKFMHVLTLENDEKVTCIQEEFLGDIRVKPKEQET